MQYLYDALNKLPLKYREAVVLHFISGFSLQEVAAIQQSTLSAVKVRVLRGKIRLRKILRVGESGGLESRNSVSFKIIQ